MAESIALDRRSDALFIIDLQNDFCPGGALGVDEGDRVVEPLNRLVPLFDFVVASQDWHPPDHCSFDEQPRFVDGSWPVHCVADTPGATLHAALALPANAYVVRKATAAEHEAYSAFDSTGLAEWLRQQGVRRVFVGGLATDFCVKASVLAACEEGFETFVLRDAVRAVAEQDAALAEMARAGARVIDSTQVNGGVA